MITFYRVGGLSLEFSILHCFLMVADLNLYYTLFNYNKVMFWLMEIDQINLNIIIFFHLFSKLFKLFIIGFSYFK